MLEESRLQNDEYEKQYYGFSSTELYADFKAETSRAIKIVLTQIESAIKEEGCNEVAQKEKIRGFYSTFMENAKIPLEKFKNEVRKIFEIPKNVVLVEDQHKTEHFTDEDIVALKKEVAELEKELLREQVFLAKCKQQKEIIDTKFKPTYDRVNSTINSLKNVLKSRSTDENKKRIIDLHEQHVQYYFGNEDGNADNSFLVEKDFFADECFDKWN